jgi:hypothetical protein
MPVPSAVISDLISLVPKHLVEPGFLYVENLALERQDGLVLSIAALLCGTAGESPSTM